MTDPQAPLKTLEPRHEFLVAIDSDGCAFDTMEIKHKECFIPNIIKHWNLQPVSRYAREAAEFVNLYSRWRGVNRFPALLEVFQLLKARDEVRRRSVSIPEAPGLKAWVEAESMLSNPALTAAKERTGDEDLARALTWSEAVNASVKDIVKGVPPFPGVRESLRRVSAWADVIVCSATPLEALEREWVEHDLAPFVRVIAGQELGKKKEHIALAMADRYPPERVLMIGDAPGDRKAARANGARFFPILPGDEDRSWARFLEKEAERFHRGEFTTEIEEALNRDFEARLPKTPPWSAGS